MNRRTLLFLSISTACGLLATRQHSSQALASESFTDIRPTTDTEENAIMLDPNPTTIEPFKQSDQEWREQLSDEAYYVLRKEGTERPFTSELNDEKRTGEFRCAGCNLALFTTEQKFDSGTGWPSFFDTIEGRVATKTDFKLIIPRTEYHCARCGGHQGHVFKDGPQPTGLRYCNNGVALRFVPHEAV